MYVVSIIVYGVKGLGTKVVCLGFTLLMRKKWKEEWKAWEAPAAIQTSEKTASLSNYYGGPPEDLRIKAENLGTLKDRKTVSIDISNTSFQDTVLLFSNGKVFHKQAVWMH